VYEKIVDEWGGAENIGELRGCTKSFINVLELGLVSNFNTKVIMGSESDVTREYSHILIELLQVGDGSIIKRVCEILIKGDIPYNTARAVYYLLVGYNSSNLVDMQSAIISFLVECARKEDGSEAFLIVPGRNTEECRSLREMILGNAPKKQKELMKEFVRAVKGRPLNEMHGNAIRVSSQDFLRKKELKNKGCDFGFVSEFM
jgi:hypothetical protein